MIRNERQYRISRAQAARFSETLRAITEKHSDVQGTHPLIVKAQKDALSSQIADLESEMREYESLKSGEFQLDGLGTVEELPTTLIKARIARGMSQKDLAERIGLKEQQIQRYEATGYASASLSRIKEVAGALRDETASPPL